MVSLYLDPTGEKVFVAPLSAHSRGSEEQRSHDLAAKLPNLTDHEKIDLLNAHIQSLEEKMALKNERIRELESATTTA